jgi:hypothetical protein
VTLKTSSTGLRATARLTAANTADDARDDDRAALGLHEPSRGERAHRRRAPVVADDEPQGAAERRAAGVDLLDGEAREVLRGAGEDVRRPGLADQETDRLLVAGDLGRERHAAVAQQPVDRLLGHLGDEADAAPGAGAAGRRVSDMARQAPAPGRVLLDDDPSRSVDGDHAAGAVERLAGPQAGRQAEAHDRARAQPVALGLEEPAAPVRGGDEVEDLLDGALDQLVIAEDQVAHGSWPPRR